MYDMTIFNIYITTIYVLGLNLYNTHLKKTKQNLKQMTSAFNSISKKLDQLNEPKEARKKK